MEDNLITIEYPKDPDYYYKEKKNKKTEKNQKSNDDFDTITICKNDYFQLLTHYYDELKHRDNLFWKEIFAYFYAVLIVSIIPIISPEHIVIPSSIPKCIFHYFGIILAIVFLFISRSYAIRFECISKTHQRFLDALPKGLQRIKVENLSKCKLYYGWMTKFIPYVMFGLLILLNIILIVFN